MGEKEQDIHKDLNKMENPKQSTSGYKEKINISKNRKSIDITGKGDVICQVINKQSHAEPTLENRSQ